MLTNRGRQKASDLMRSSWLLLDAASKELLVLSFTFKSLLFKAYLCVFSVCVLMLMMIKPTDPAHFLLFIS